MKDSSTWIQCHSSKETDDRFIMVATASIALDFANSFMERQSEKVYVVDEYDSYAPDYDLTYNSHVYKAPLLVADAAARYVDDKQKANVIDIAAGTGLAGEGLYSFGFRHLTALDPSTEMLRHLKEKRVYGKIIQDTIGDHKIDVEDDTYDAVVMAGGFVSGHVPYSALDEMIRIVRPGGFIIVSMRYEYLHLVKEFSCLEDYMNNLEKKGMWKLRERNITEKYFFDRDGITFVYEKI